MNRKSFFALHLFLSLLLIPLATNAQHTPVASEKSYQHARRVLDAGIQALGGLDALRAIQGFTLKESGKTHFAYQSPGPDPPFGSAPMEEVTAVDFRSGRLVNEAKNSFPGASNWTKTIIKGNEGFTLDMRSKTAAAIANPSVLNFRGQFRRLPHFLLLEALERAVSLRWVGEDDFRGQKQNVISMVRNDGRQLALYFDAKTNLLTKYDYLYTDGVAGDSIVEQIYFDYRDVGGVKVPRRRLLMNAGYPAQETEYTEVQFNSQLADALFEVPQGFERFAAADQQPAAGALSKLADDVYLLSNLAGAGYNVLFVAFNDHVLVVEAPEPFPYSSVSEQVIAKIKETVPGKPIKYVVLTHHHSDHAGGARGYIAEGTTIVTTPSNKRFIERLTAAPFKITQDALVRSPRTPIVETIENKKRVFRDDRHVVELYDIGPNPHANEMTVVYLPKEKILFQSDLINTADGRLPAAQDAGVHLAEKIGELGLDVERIVGAHGRTVTAEEMRASVEKRRRMN